MAVRKEDPVCVQLVRQRTQLEQLMLGPMKAKSTPDGVLIKMAAALKLLNECLQEYKMSRKNDEVTHVTDFPEERWQDHVAIDIVHRCATAPHLDSTFEHIC